MLSGFGLGCGYLAKGPVLFNRSLGTRRQDEPAGIAHIAASDRLQYPPRKHTARRLRVSSQSGISPSVAVPPLRLAPPASREAPVIGGRRVGVVIPALNEGPAVARVIAEIPPWVDDVVVADNGSRDDTALRARAAGARVVSEVRRGYGSACLKAISALDPGTDIVVFLDADYSDHPREMERVVAPIVAGRAQLVIGSRTRGKRQPGALTPQARWGNWLACLLIRTIWKVEFTDLGPFRAICRRQLEALGMRDPDYGWTVEMQVRAVRKGLRVTEVPVSYRRRIGQSKVSGTLRGVWGAGTKILWTIFRAAVRPTG